MHARCNTARRLKVVQAFRYGCDDRIICQSSPGYTAALYRNAIRSLYEAIAYR